MLGRYSAISLQSIMQRGKVSIVRHSFAYHSKLWASDARHNIGAGGGRHSRQVRLLRAATSVIADAYCDRTRWPRPPAATLFSQMTYQACQLVKARDSVAPTPTLPLRTDLRPIGRLPHLQKAISPLTA